MTVTTDVEVIRQQIAALPGHKNSRRYSAELRGRVAAWARPWLAKGRSIPALASELGMGEPTLRKFLAPARAGAVTANAGFEPVRVMPVSRVPVPERSPRPVVRGPCGLIVENLSLEAIAQLLRRLSCSA